MCRLREPRVLIAALFPPPVRRSREAARIASTSESREDAGARLGKGVQPGRAIPPDGKDAILARFRSSFLPVAVGSCRVNVVRQME